MCPRVLPPLPTGRPPRPRCPRYHQPRRLPLRARPQLTAVHQRRFARPVQMTEAPAQPSGATFASSGSARTSVRFTAGYDGQVLMSLSTASRSNYGAAALSLLPTGRRPISAWTKQGKRAGSRPKSSLTSRVGLARQHTIGSVQTTAAYRPNHVHRSQAGPGPSTPITVNRRRILGPAAYLLSPD